jgi:hypothetical protein
MLVCSTQHYVSHTVLKVAPVLSIAFGLGVSYGLHHFAVEQRWRD